MQDRVGQFLASLSDPSQYVVVKDVPVFDEHTDVVWVKDNRTVAKGTPGARRVVHKFDRARLERIASNCNARLRRGDAAPLAIGHTDPNNPDERDQPDLVGYAANYKVGYSERHGRHMLYADYHIAREHYPEARKFPRTSVELWPEGEKEFLDPISLIKRTPQRDLGQWVYGRQGKLVLRYSMEHSMNDDLNDLGGDAGGDAGAGAAAEPSHEERAERFMRHCFSHPDAGHFAKHYSMADAPPGDEPPADQPPPEPPPGDPTEPPSADKPSQFSAAPAFPGASNAGLPKPAQHRRGAAPVSQDARIAKLERQLDEALRFARETHEKANATEAQRLVAELEAEGYDLDPAQEVPVLAALDDAGRRARCEYIRRYFRQSPTAPLGRVRLADDDATGGRGPAAGQPRNSDQHMEALRYLRVHGGSYDAALAAVKKG